MTKIAIILGSTRPGRKGEQVAHWILERARERGTAEYELLDLAEIGLPHLDEAIPAGAGQYANAHTKQWAATVARFDGFIFVTPEYNHSIPGALKNAIDYVGAEWANKAAGFVGYGVYGGVRAIEHLRLVLSQLQVATVTQAAAFNLMTDFQDMSEFRPADYHAASVAGLFDQVEAWSGALAPLRAVAEPAAA